MHPVSEPVEVEPVGVLHPVVLQIVSAPPLLEMVGVDAHRVVAGVANDLFFVRHLLVQNIINKALRSSAVCPGSRETGAGVPLDTQVVHHPVRENRCA